MAVGLNTSFGNVPGKSHLGGKRCAHCYRLHKKVQARSKQYPGEHSVRGRVVLPAFQHRGEDAPHAGRCLCLPPVSRHRVASYRRFGFHRDFKKLKGELN